MGEVMGGMVMSHFESFCCMDWVFTVFNEVGFLEPTSNVVFLVMERVQSPCKSLPAMMSTHGINDCCEVLKEVV